MVRGEKLLVISIIFLLLASLITTVSALNETVQDDTTSADTTTEDIVSDVATVVGDTPNTIRGYEWLYNTTQSQIETLSDSDLSLVLIALLGDSKQRDLTSIITKLKTDQDSITGCWPKTGCKVKDTALATLGMYLSGQTEIAKAGAKWLKDAKVAGLNTGDWLISIKSTGTGKCTIAANERTHDYNVEGDQIEGASGHYSLNLKEIDPALVRKIIPEISVDCSGIENPIITLLYKPNSNTYFIQNAATSSNVVFKVANACYGETKTSRCDYESTAWATLTLLELGSYGTSLEEAGTITYLQTQFKLDGLKESDIIALSLLNRILYKSGSSAPTFINELVKGSKQKPDGSWSEKTYTTSLALFGLSGSDKTDAIGKAIKYLSTSQEDTGAWDNSLVNTAVALIGLHGIDLGKRTVETTSTIATTNRILTERDCSNYDEIVDGLTVCSDESCSTDLKALCENGIKDRCEEEKDCGGPCDACEEAGTTTAQCTDDSDCASGKECVEDRCVTKTESTTPTTPETTDTNSGSLWWLWLLIIILVIGGGVVFFYTKYVSTGKVNLSDIFGKKTKGPSFDEFRRTQEFRPAQQQRVIQKPQGNVSRQPMRPVAGKPKEEDELEKAIREAQRIIKGK